MRNTMEALSNEERLRKLAEEFFRIANDPSQLQVDETVLNHLRALHPASLGEERSQEGPIAWTLVIPTTEILMQLFLENKLNENDLCWRTTPNDTYTAVYLCSAIVLPEFRRKGIAKRLLINSIRAIQKDYPLRSLFYWPFSEEGNNLAHAVARECGLQLYKRTTTHDHRRER